jgi:xylulokinase
LDVELVTVNTSEGAAYGAALLAGVGAELFESVQSAADQTIQITGHTPPGPDAKIYPDYYPLYRALYPALAETFKQINAVVSH